MQNQKQLIDHLIKNGKTHTWRELADMYGIMSELPNDVQGNKKKCDYVRRLYGKVIPPKAIPSSGKAISSVLSEWDEFVQFKKSKLNYNLPTPYTNGDKNNVLVIGDLHLPFTDINYLKFCREQQERFNCGTVIQIGDIVDHHAQSFHASDADGLSARDELILAVKQLQDWYKVFPEVTITLGNHDRIIARKLFSVGISQRWMKPLGEVLETPNWKFVEQIIHNNIMYVHGEGGTAVKKASDEMISVCQGHLHTEGYIQFLNGGKNFGMQVGCGIDFNTYAFAYAQRGKRPVLSCGVVLNQSPILIPMI